MKLAYQYKLVPLKKEREWYADIHSHVLQDMVRRVDLSFTRFIRGDGNGKRSGKPRFKGKNRYRTFAYQQVKSNCIRGKREARPKGSKARRKLNERIARLHQRIARQRKQWHFEVAGELVARAKELEDRWHKCYHCGASMTRDLNSEILLAASAPSASKKVGLGVASLKNANSRL